MENEEEKNLRIEKNLSLWNEAFVTDPRAVKAITGKSYKGNSPKPYWIIQRATEIFGPVGIGWGVTVKSERFVNIAENEVLHVAVVSVWYVRDGVRAESFDQMGGTKAAYMSNAGKLIVDEDAGKKSVTDGMVKCLSMIGFAGDIFSGMWDDSKYVQWAGAQYAPRPEGQQKAGVKNDPREGIGDDISADWKTYLTDLAAECTELCQAGNPGEAVYKIDQAQLEADQKTWMWNKLDSKIRSMLKTAATVAR